MKVQGYTSLILWVANNNLPYQNYRHLNLPYTSQVCAKTWKKQLATDEYGFTQMKV